MTGNAMEINANKNSWLLREPPSATSARQEGRGENLYWAATRKKRRRAGSPRITANFVDDEGAPSAFFLSNNRLGVRGTMRSPRTTYRTGGRSPRGRSVVSGIGQGPLEIPTGHGAAGEPSDSDSLGGRSWPKRLGFRALTTFRLRSLIRRLTAVVVTGGGRGEGDGVHPRRVAYFGTYETMT